MPVFGAAEIDQRQLDELTAYVRYLREPEDPGGFPIGRIGPIPEGFVAWSVGIGRPARRWSSGSAPAARSAGRKSRDAPHR